MGKRGRKQGSCVWGVSFLLGGGNNVRKAGKTIFFVYFFYLFFLYLFHLFDSGFFYMGKNGAHIIGPYRFCYFFYSLCWLSGLMVGWFRMDGMDGWKRLFTTAAG